MTAPAMAAVAVAPGTASADTIQPYCMGSFALAPAATQPGDGWFDRNGDGYVCLKLNGNGHMEMNDDEHGASPERHA